MDKLNGDVVITSVRYEIKDIIWVEIEGKVFATRVLSVKRITRNPSTYANLVRLTSVTFPYEILPCPFCGGDTHESGILQVRCKVCKCRTDTCYDRVDAIEIWNRRV